MKKTIINIYIIVSFLMMTILLLSLKNATNRFEEITVKRINIVDEQGNNVMVLSNDSRFPYPRMNGQEFKQRSISPAGVVFYNKKGDECGGIGIVDIPEINMTKMIFDYNNSEAIGLGMWETKSKGDYGAGLVIAERMPLDSDPIKNGTSGPERLSLCAEKKDVYLQLNAPDGTPRMKLLVDSTGSPSFFVYSESGEIKEILGKD